jgi:hypothetical protein
MFFKEIKEAFCSCGGKLQETETTEKEIEQWGCFRDRPRSPCCVLALRCLNCGVRLVFVFESPDWD